MPITPFLDNTRFDPEATRVMGIAFEMVRWPSGLHTGATLLMKSSPRRLIELAKAGERNPIFCASGH